MLQSPWPESSRFRSCAESPSALRGSRSCLCTVLAAAAANDSPGRLCQSPYADAQLELVNYMEKQLRLMKLQNISASTSVVSRAVISVNPVSGLLGIYQPCWQSSHVL